MTDIPIEDYEVPNFIENIIIPACDTCGADAQEWGADYISGCPDCGTEAAAAE